jgi:hypothetical protein
MKYRKVNEMTEENKEFKRVSFFRGFFASEDDFNHLVDYDLEKHRLHNRLHHSPGVMLNFSGELRVIAREKGDFSIEIAPGYAIDGLGNDIFLWETKVLAIDVSKYRLPIVVYLVLKYFDEPVDFITNKANPQYKGHKRIAERAKLEFSATPPEITEGIELARVRLEEDLKDVKNPADPRAPQAGELDCRFAPIAGSFGWFLSPEIKSRIFTVYNDMKVVFMQLNKLYDLKYSLEAYQAALTAEMVSIGGKIDYRNAFELIRIIVDIEKEISAELENTPNLSQRKEVGEYKDNLQALLNLTSASDITSEDLNNLIIYQSKASNSLKKLLAPKVAEIRSEIEGELEEFKGERLSMDEIKIWSKEFPEELMVDEVRYKLVDWIDILNDQSEKDHEFKLGGVKEELRQKQNFFFPDGTRMSDRGRLHWEGFAQFKIKNLKPELDILMIRRIDYAYGGLKTDIEVDGEKVGVWEISGNDRKYRWRNMPYIINGKFITKEEVVVKQTAISAERDVNMFGYWFYQAIV